MGMHKDGLTPFARRARLLPWQARGRAGHRSEAHPPPRLRGCDSHRAECRPRMLTDPLRTDWRCVNGMDLVGPAECQARRGRPTCDTSWYSSAEYSRSFVV
jgi:hypothetical protein